MGSFNDSLDSLKSSSVSIIAFEVECLLCPDFFKETSPNCSISRSVSISSNLLGDLLEKFLFVYYSLVASEAESNSSINFYLNALRYYVKSILLFPLLF